MSIAAYSGPLPLAAIKIQIAAAPQFSSGGGGSVPIPFIEELLSGTLSVAYSVAADAQGGVAPYTFSVLTGSLPTGLSLNSLTGVISGTPSATGTFNFTIQATDSNGSQGSTAFQIVIAAPASGGNYSYAA